VTSKGIVALLVRTLRVPAASKVVVVVVVFRRVAVTRTRAPAAVVRVALRNVRTEETRRRRRRGSRPSCPVAARRTSEGDGNVRYVAAVEGRRAFRPRPATPQVESIAVARAGGGRYTLPAHPPARETRVLRVQGV